MSETETFDADAGILRLLLSNENTEPRLTVALIERLHVTLASAPPPRLVVLEGAEGQFCEGLQLSWLSQAASDAAQRGEIKGLITRYGELLDALRQMPCPVVALVDGPALGGGVGLVAVADLVLASSRASFALPEVLFGLVPAMALPYVRERIGGQKARLLAMGIAPISAETALRWGLVDEVVDSLLPAFGRHARRLVRADETALALVKRLTATTIGPAFRAQAADEFTELVCRPANATRLSRFVSGEAPWEPGESSD